MNALLSLGYSLLAANMMSALEIVGLDPYCGFLHSTVYGRPALALDLMEEFRPIIVDSVVLSLVNKKMIKVDDFYTSANGVFLKKRGRKVFFQAYSKRIRTKIMHPLVGRPLSYQKIFEVQARQIARYIEGKQTGYRAFLVK